MGNSAQRSVSAGQVPPLPSFVCRSSSNKRSGASQPAPWYRGCVDQEQSFEGWNQPTEPPNLQRHAPVLDQSNCFKCVLCRKKISTKLSILSSAYAAYMAELLTWDQLPAVHTTCLRSKLPHFVNWDPSSKETSVGAFIPIFIPNDAQHEEIFQWITSTGLQITKAEYDEASFKRDCPALWWRRSACFVVEPWILPFEKLVPTIQCLLGIVPCVDDEKLYNVTDNHILWHDTAGLPTKAGTISTTAAEIKESNSSSSTTAVGINEIKNAVVRAYKQISIGFGQFMPDIQMQHTKSTKRSTKNVYPLVHDVPVAMLLSNPKTLLGLHSQLKHSMRVLEPVPLTDVQIDMCTGQSTARPSVSPQALFGDLFWQTPVQVTYSNPVPVMRMKLGSFFFTKSRLGEFNTGEMSYIVGVLGSQIAPPSTTKRPPFRRRRPTVFDQLGKLRATGSSPWLSLNVHIGGLIYTEESESPGQQYDNKCLDRLFGLGHQSCCKSPTCFLQKVRDITVLGAFHIVRTRRPYYHETKAAAVYSSTWSMGRQMQVVRSCPNPVTPAEITGFLNLAGRLPLHDVCKVIVKYNLPLMLLKLLRTDHFNDSNMFGAKVRSFYMQCLEYLKNPNLKNLYVKQTPTGLEWKCGVHSNLLLIKGGKKCSKFGIYQVFSCPECGTSTFIGPTCLKCARPPSDNQRCVCDVRCMSCNTPWFAVRHIDSRSYSVFGVFKLFFAGSVEPMCLRSALHRLGKPVFFSPSDLHVLLMQGQWSHPGHIRPNSGFFILLKQCYSMCVCVYVCMCV